MKTIIIILIIFTAFSSSMAQTYPNHFIYSLINNEQGSYCEEVLIWLSIGETSVSVSHENDFIHPRIKEILENEKELKYLQKENEKLKTDLLETNEFVENLQELIKLIQAGGER